LLLDLLLFGLLFLLGEDLLLVATNIEHMLLLECDITLLIDIDI
jgi:hypothetical protein